MEARLLTEWAKLDRAQGQEDDAAKRLEAALSTFKHLGAAKDVEAVEELLSQPAERPAPKPS